MLTVWVVSMVRYVDMGVETKVKVFRTEVGALKYASQVRLAHIGWKYVVMEMLVKDFADYNG